MIGAVARIGFPRLKPGADIAKSLRDENGEARHSCRIRSSITIWCGTPKRRAPMIDGGRADLITRSMQAICTEAGVLVHGIGIMPDHVHVAVSIPPRIAIAEFVQRLKGTDEPPVERHGRAFEPWPVCAEAARIRRALIRGALVGTHRGLRE